MNVKKRKVAHLRLKKANKIWCARSEHSIIISTFVSKLISKQTAFRI